MIEQLILVRHGETVHNVAGLAQGWGDSALSERGQRQVAALAHRVARMKPAAIFSSPLQRARTTADAIAGSSGLDVQLIDDLREMNYGTWEGKSFLDVRRNDEESYRRWISDLNFPSPEGESHQHVFDRMRRAFEAIRAAANGHPVVAVTHGNAIRIAATVLLELPLSASRNLAQDNAAINISIWRGDRYVLKVWNDNTHCEER